MSGTTAGVLIGILLANLPPVDMLTCYKPAAQTVVFDKESNAIGQYYDERRLVLRRDEIPDRVIQSLLAAEDRLFYEHGGFDLKGIARALISNLKNRGISQGGSTITQQVARLMFLTNERTFSRKIKEALLTLLIERKFSKDEIITIYLNQSCFGHGAFGIEAAAKTFFNKSTGDLTVPESALLMSLLKNPTRFSPIKYPDRSKESRNRVLVRMSDAGFISREDLTVWLDEAMNINPDVQQGFIAPYFVEEIRRTLEVELGQEMLLKGGLRVRSTLDSRHQDCANRAIQQGLESYRERHPDADAIQAALISMRPASGDITAMVGGSSFRATQFNRAVQAKRQPGSSIKPFLYLAALMDGYTPSTIIMDSPYTYKDPATGRLWSPGNYDRHYRGPVTLRRSLEESLNVPTAKLVEKIGINKFLDVARRAGIQSELPPYPSTVLGAGEVTLIELTNAYATLASGGLKVRPRMILGVEDRDGRTIYKQDVSIQEVLPPVPCFQLAGILEGAVKRGTAWRAKGLERPVAAKTGTTDDCTNAWFIGFTPDLVVGVWIGFDVNQSMGHDETGSKAAGPVFTEFLKSVLQGEPVQEFHAPQGIEFKDVCYESGFLASPRCPIVIHEAYSINNPPKTICPVH
ncbi:PBP1A family penicillin-binding protein [bacterium]|nr:PBP1A family penicillin-binding protein [candidate division CSSED10-310 bacterium]